jgi:hypothetical protein
MARQGERVRIIAAGAAALQKDADAVFGVRLERAIAAGTAIRLRSIACHAINSNARSVTTFAGRLLGCSGAEARAHLTSLFKPGMSWDRASRSQWHIDHIVPCSAFDLSDPEQARRCFHYTNLQPLWARENGAKGGVRRKSAWAA